MNDKNNGSFDWLIKVPDMEISNMILYKRSLLTFSNKNNLLRLWSTVDGSLMWESFLGYKVIPAADSNSTVDESMSSMTLNIPYGIVTILTNNCLHFINVNGVVLWQWCADEATSDSPDQRAVLAHLITPSTVKSNDQEKKSRKVSKVAVGCLTDNTGLCVQTIVIVVDFSNQQVFMDVFSGLDVKPTDVRGLVSSTVTKNDDDYIETDVIFGVIHDASSTTTSLNIITLQGFDMEGSKTESHMHSVPLPTNSDDVLKHARSYLYTNGDVKTPGVSLCSKDTCVYHNIVQTKNSWSVSNEHSIECDNKGNAGGSATMGYQQQDLNSYSAKHNRYAAIAGVSCMHLSVKSDHQDVHLVTYDNKIVKTSTTLPTSYLYRLTGGLVRLLPTISNKGTYVMALGSAGLVFSFEKQEKSLELKWMQDYSISHITQVKVVDHSHIAIHDILSAGNRVLSEMPTYEERLQMQYLEIQEYLQDFVDEIRADPVGYVSSTVSHMVGNALVSAGVMSKHRLNQVTGSAGKSMSDRDKLIRDKHFGFNKLAICVAYVPVACSCSHKKKLRILGVDLSSRAVAWSIEPNLPAIDTKSSLTKLLYANVVNNPHPSDTCDAASRTCASTVATHMDHFELLLSNTEQMHSNGDGASHDANKIVAFHVPVTTYDEESVLRVMIEESPSDNKHPVISVMENHAVDTHKKQFQFLLNDCNVQVYITDTGVTAGIGVEHVEASGANNIREAMKDHYVYGWQSKADPKKCIAFDEDQLFQTNGILQIFKVRPETCAAIAGGIHQCETEIVSRVNFDEDLETVVGVTTHKDSDAVHSRATVLGDDSVLLKFLNPHVILVTSVSSAQAATPFADMSYTTTSANNELEAKAALEVLPTSLYVTLVDVISGKILYRTEIESATAPVHSTLMENNIVLSYWNTVVKRTEMAVMSMYGGMIDKYSLVPGANKPAINRANLNEDGTKSVSSYSLNPPVVQHKMYVLPRSVTAMTHSTTSQGISHKNILLGLNTHQVYAMDMRHVSPRRPVNAPTQQEKEEVGF